MSDAARPLVDSDPASFEVSQEISPNDEMFQGSPNHYYAVGRSALNAIGLALRAAEKDREEVRTILDLPCGHGRVLRALQAAFPNATITACDIDPDGVDFCASAFGAVPVYSKKDPSEIELPGQSDLIWCGSLLTHVGLDHWRGFLRLFASALAPGGVLVFTTAGRWASSVLRSSLPLFDEIGDVEEAKRERPADRKVMRLIRRSYNLPKESVERVLAGYEQEGFAFVDYPLQTDYGISLAAPRRVSALLEELEGIRIVNFTERGWDTHQDVTACKWIGEEQHVD